MRHGEFRDLRLVEAYDAECPWGPDDDFFLAVVEDAGGGRVLDLGCGTGRLTLVLAAAGHDVTGVDPAAASLAAARAKSGAERVTWIEATSMVLADDEFDVAVMTSHVAQFFVADDEWEDVLADLARSLRPGGRLTFDTRDPRDRAWERWNPVDSRRRIPMPDGRIVGAETEVTAVDGGIVAFTHRYEFPDGEELVSTAALRFRSEDEVRASLAEVGFNVDEIYGGWHRQPVGDGDGELLVVATARGGDPAGRR